MINDNNNNYNNNDNFHEEGALNLPMVLSTSKPNPLLDFPALCISASFLPKSDWEAINHN